MNLDAVGDFTGSSARVATNAAAMAVRRAPSHRWALSSALLSVLGGGVAGAVRTDTAASTGAVTSGRPRSGSCEPRDWLVSPANCGPWAHTER